MLCLLLRLDAPLMAFGDVAVDEIRPTRRLPTLSMITGLLANALGYDHGEVERLQRLQDRLLLGTQLDRPGRVIVDYQTAAIGKRDPLWTTRGRPAERAGGEGSYDGPVIRRRHYVADAVVTCALAFDPADEAPDLLALAAALVSPERPLFLGRKGCPPAAPLLLGPPVEVDSIYDALAAAPPAKRGPRREMPEHLVLEVPDRPGEPTRGRILELADRRDWRTGLHAGTRRVREVLNPSSTAGQGAGA